MLSNGAFTLECMYCANNSCRNCVSLDLNAVLKGIEDVKAKGFNPPAVQDEARTLADKHLKVRSTLLVDTLWSRAACCMTSLCNLVLIVMSHIKFASCACFCTKQQCHDYMIA